MTIDEYNLMRHAIGFSRKKVKRNKYVASRNYFCAAINTPDCSDWFDLCQFGYAKMCEERESIQGECRRAYIS